LPGHGASPACAPCTLDALADLLAAALPRRVAVCGWSLGAQVALGAGLRLLRETDLRDTLERIAQPALILHGERDTLVPPAAGEYLQHVLPHAVLEGFAGTAHALHIAQPQRTTRRIVEFCREP
jgi:pimeloyl-[acyl-carrier protein] methyl ester esterase